METRVERLILIAILVAVLVAAIAWRAGLVR